MRGGGLPEDEHGQALFLFVLAVVVISPPAVYAGGSAAGEPVFIRH